MWRQRWIGAFGICLLAAALPLSAKAAGDLPEPKPVPSSSAWEFDGGLYAWALWVEGDATTRGLTFDVYADPVDLIDALDGPIIMANFEARRGRFALYLDAVYAKFAHDASFLGEATPLRPLTITLDAQAEADFEFGVYEAVGFYEIAHFVGANGNATTFELGAGARWVREELDVTLGVDLTIALALRRERLARRFDFTKNFQRVVARSGVMEWVDPLAGARVKHDFGGGKSITAMGNVDGFDTNDDFSWEAILTYDCDGTLFGYETTTSLGYKALGLTFEEQTSKGARGIDVVLHGPVAEFKLRW